MPEEDAVLTQLVDLSRSLGSDSKRLAILAEGNVSGAIDEESFWVKASGVQMRLATATSFVQMRFAPIVSAFSSGDLSDREVRGLLADSRSRNEGPVMPSVETFMHAYLLQLPGIAIVGHTHPTPLVSLLCLKEASEISKQRLFPDDVVCCGPESAFVPYTDPGLPLARAIQGSVERYVETWGSVPKTIWLANHGLIALGRSSSEVESATLMTEKSAEVWLGVLGSQGRPRPLSPEEVARIHSRPDEHYRQQLLWQVQTETKS